MAVLPLRVAGTLVVLGVAFGALTGSQPSLATALTLTLAALVAALILRRGAAIPAFAPQTVSALRGGVRRTARLRQSDPNTSGRPRPRAPSVA
jgi:hypothetical protein